MLAVGTEELGEKHPEGKAPSSDPREKHPSRNNRQFVCCPFCISSFFFRKDFLLDGICSLVEVVIFEHSFVSMYSC